MIEGEHSMQQKNDFSRRLSVENMVDVSPITKMRMQRSKYTDSPIMVSQGSSPEPLTSTMNNKIDIKFVKSPAFSS